MVLRKNRYSEGWDSEPITDSRFQPSVARLRAFVRRAGLTWSTPDAVLNNLGLRSGSSFRNAASLFFARKPTLKLRCAVFTTDSGPTLLDQHDFTGDLPSLIEEAERYILRNIRIGMRLEGFVRVDVPEIPTPALREAIINAFCHRDYRDPDEVRVAIFPNRVEIRNPGTLPEGLTIDDLRSKQISRRRNPLVASLLQRLHLIEAWGRGISLILSNAPHATFQQVGPVLITTLPRGMPAKHEAQVGDKISPGRGQVARTPQLESGVESGVESPWVLRVLSLMEAGPRTKSEVARELGKAKPSRHLHETMARLVASGALGHTLPDKPTSRLQRYRLTPIGRAILASRH